jgi:hypothetical protein
MKINMCVISSPTHQFIVLGLLVSLFGATHTYEFGHEDYEKVCGSVWQKKYADHHRAVLEGDELGTSSIRLFITLFTTGRKPQKYIVSVPVLAGTADMYVRYLV